MHKLAKLYFSSDASSHILVNWELYISEKYSHGTKSYLNDSEVYTFFSFMPSYLICVYLYICSEPC